MQSTPFVIGFYSSGSPARGVIASAILQSILEERFAGRVPVEGVTIIESRSIDQDKIVGRVLEALSKEGVDVPPTRVVLVGEEPVDCYVAFTREEAGKAAGAPVYLLGDLAGSGAELPDTLGDFKPMVSRIKELVDAALPRLLLLARHKHLTPIIEMAKTMVDEFRSLSRSLASIGSQEGFSRAASLAESLEDKLFRLVGAKSPARSYVESYGNVCFCGGTMQLVSEKLSRGVYELVFVCNKCGRRSVRYQ